MHQKQGLAAWALLAMGALTGCVPMVGDHWIVQPVSGRVYVAGTGAALANAGIVNEGRPELATQTNGDGRFAIPGQSETVFEWAMPASYLDRQYWRVHHDGYAEAITVTATLAPPRSRQPSLVEVPMFAGLAADPANCRFGHYRVHLANYLIHQGQLAEQAVHRLSELDGLPCADADLQQQWQTALDQAYRQPTVGTEE